MSTSIDFQALLNTVENATDEEALEAEAGGTTVLIVDLPDGRVLSIGEKDGPFVVRQDHDGAPGFVEADGFTVWSYPDRTAHDDGQGGAHVGTVAPSLPLLEAVLRAAVVPGATPGPRNKRLRIVIEADFGPGVSDADLEAVADAAAVQVQEPVAPGEHGNERRLPLVSVSTFTVSITPVSAS